MPSSLPLHPFPTTLLHRAAPDRLVAALALIALMVGFAASGEAQRFKRDKPYPDGTKILITGVVSDLSGNPVDDLLVELVAKRYGFKVARMGKKVEREVRVSSQTNDRGEYNIQWVWYRYYNDFELEASIEVPTGADTVRKEVLARTELNNRIEQGAPVIVPLVIADPAFLETFRRFVAGLDTDDEQRVYAAQGRPDKVDALDLPDRSEEAWWYFERGKVYRFIDGRLDQVEDFEPVP